MSQSHYTINEVSEPRFAGEVVRAALFEDNAGGLDLFLLDEDERAVYAIRYYGNLVVYGMTYQEIAAADWIALHVARVDPDRDDWDNEVEAGADDYEALSSARGTHCIADTLLISQTNPLGLDYEAASHSGLAFIRAAIEGVPEYEDLSRRLEDLV